MTTDSDKTAMGAANDRRSDRPRGFTLVELIVTIALIAILAAFAVPSLQNVTRQGEGRTTARELANAFRMARDAATSRGQVVYARMRPDEGQGQIELRRSEDNAASCQSGNHDNSNDKALLETVKVSETSGDLSIQGMSHTNSGSDLWVCFSPSGEVLTDTGNEFSDEDHSCGRGNFRLWVSSVDPTSDDDSTDERDCDPGASVRDQRYLDNFWAVTVRYNGNVRIEQ